MRVFHTQSKYVCKIKEIKGVSGVLDNKKHTPISQGKTKPQSNYKVKFLAVNLTKIVEWELIFIIFQWTLANQI